jgi:acyl carrier protein
MTQVKAAELTVEMREIIAGFAYVEELCDDDPLELDSLAIAELLMVVEERHGAAVAESLVESDVRSITSIAAAVQRIHG